MSALRMGGTTSGGVNPRREFRRDKPGGSSTISPERKMLRVPVRLLLVALLLAVGLAGCKQAFVETKGCLKVEDEPVLPPRGPDGAACAPEAAPTPDAISTVANPEAARREISLAECLALALENGRTGEFYDRPGSDRRTSVSGLARLGPPANATDSMRVFAYDPALSRTDVEQSLAKFDTVWQTIMDWNHVGPPRNLAPEMVPPAGLLNDNGLIDNVDFRTELLKPLPTGGVAGVGFRTDYERANLPFGSPVINPAYQPGIDFSFEQPLLQGAGLLFGLLRENRPESYLHPNLPPGGRVPGILLTRLAHDQARLEFERRVQELLFRVEEAYWELYCAYWDLYSRENALQQAHAVWMIARTKYEAGGLTDEELAQAEEQYHLFQSQRLEALGRGIPGRPGVLEAERRLRYVVGLPPEDGTRLVPSDAPALTPVAPDWKAAVAEAMAFRPELVQVRKDIRAGQLVLERARNLLLPDLRFISRYSVNGVAGELDDSYRNLAHAPFSAWELRLQMQVPIGFRDAHAEVDRARLLLSQRLAFLRDQEAKVVLSLQRSQRELVQFREEIRTRRAQREAAAVQVRTRYAKFRAGKGSLEFLLQAQRGWADALRDEYVAVCNYNVALADFERQKGTILRYDNVSVVDAVPAGCAPRRASEQIRRWCRPLPAPTVPGPAEKFVTPARSASEGAPSLALRAGEVLSHQGNSGPADPALPGLVDFEHPPRLLSLEGGALPEMPERPAADLHSIANK